MAIGLTILLRFSILLEYTPGVLYVQSGLTIQVVIEHKIISHRNVSYRITYCIPGPAFSCQGPGCY